MSEQFDVFRNPGLSRAAIPFVVVVQSNEFRASAQRVVMPLLDLGGATPPKSDLAPTFTIDGRRVVLDPLRITNVPVRVLGKAVCSLTDQEDLIMNALDSLLSRAWR